MRPAWPARALLVLFALLAVVTSVATAGCNRFGSCDAADVYGVSRTCSGAGGWVWNGTSCIFSQKCVCTGDDCNSMYQNKDVCEAAHAHCPH